MPYTPFANQEYRNVVQTHLEIPALLRLLPVGAGSRILEIGCGRGVALPRLRALCAPSRLVGVDIAADLIAVAEHRMTGVAATAQEPATELVVADVRGLPFAEASFDVVIDFGTCYHIDDPGLALREICRVLDRGGRFIHESTLAQRIAHPWRTSGRGLPWGAVPSLRADRDAILWAARRKTSSVAH